MMAWIAEIQRAWARRQAERVIRGLNQRGLLVLAVCIHGVYQRIYMDTALGVMVLTPRVAALHLKHIERREFERALSVR